MDAAPVSAHLMDAAPADEPVNLGPPDHPAVDLGEVTDGAPSGDARAPTFHFSKPLDEVMAAVVAPPAAAAPLSHPLVKPTLREDLLQLRREVVAISAAATSAAELAAQTEIDDVVRRLRAEQDRLYSLIMDHLPVALRGAAHTGARSAVVLHFAGQDKLDEFCYLYMLKGPTTSEGKATLRRLGIVPVLARLREALNPAGFRVWHTWERATNENTLAVSW